jgi:multiple sugar transport system substrate-binding protein
VKKFLVSLVILGMILGGCQGLDFNKILARKPTLQPTATPTTIRRQLSATATQESTRPVKNGPPVLILWLPPQLDPYGSNAAAALLRARIDGFQTLNPEIKLQVRIKSQTGAGGMLDSLSAASAAAPGVMPSLVALSRPELEDAAAKNLILPVDGSTEVLKDSDWYEYARQMAAFQGNTFGFPFGGDSLVLVYRPSRVGSPPSTWDGLVRLGLTVDFPAADTRALFSLALYESLGGTVVDAQGRQALSTETLTTVLKMYSEGVQQNVFPVWLSQVQNDDQAWQAFLDQRAQMVITTNSRYLTDVQPDTAVALLPGFKTESHTLADSWIWAVTDRQPDRRQISIRLAEYLVKGDFLTSWTEAAGYLPTRPSSLAGWSSQKFKSQFNQLALTSHPRPANRVTAGLGPILQEAVLSIIKRQNDPARAAAVAVERLGVPKPR